MSRPLNYDPADPDKMRLPAGITCGDCTHIRRCKAIYGHTESDAYCDWSPSRFARKAVQIKAAAVAVSGPLTAAPAQVDRRVLNLMVESGGACVHHLGKAWLCADPDNSRRLADAFGHIYDRYAAQLQAMDSARTEVAA